VFGNARKTLSSPANDPFYEAGTSASEARARGHERFQDEEVFRMVTAGLVRPIDSALALYAGLGYTSRRAYREFFDPDEETGNLGFYWVDHEDETRSAMNVTGGILIRVSEQLFMQAGAELFPGGAAIAVYLAFPW
jgi:opacity protein-like surface antigen